MTILNMKCSQHQRLLVKHNDSLVQTNNTCELFTILSTEPEIEFDLCSKMKCLSGNFIISLIDSSSLLPTDHGGFDLKGCVSLKLMVNTFDAQFNIFMFEI